MTTIQTTAGAGGGSTGSSSARDQWSNLPDDIFGNIHLKIATLRDRVRLAAVCRTWRTTVARLPAPPAVPLLVMSPRSKTGRVRHLCGSGPDDSWVMRVSDKAVDKYLMGSYKGGWVAALDHGTRKLTLINLFSGAEVELCSLWPGAPCADLWICSIGQFIFSDDPTSSTGCILATIANDLHNVALCKLGGLSGWTTHGWENKLFTDITFCNGDLYGLVHGGKELVRFKIGVDEDGSPIVTSTHQLDIQPHDVPAVKYYNGYIMELHGKPSKAIRTRWLPNREPFFKVFELVDADAGEAYQYKWVEMSSFGEYALFLGPAKCKAMHVPLGAERHGFERNHIYYSKDTRSREYNLCGDELYSLISDDGRVMYCREDQDIGDGLGRTGYYTVGLENAAMWLDPPDL